MWLMNTDRMDKKVEFLDLGHQLFFNIVTIFAIIFVVAISILADIVVALQ